MVSIVGIVKEESPYLVVREGLGLLGGLGNYIEKGSRVLIKPNLCSLRPWETGATTDPQLTRELLIELLGLTRNVAVVESDHAGLDAETVFERLGFREVTVEMGVEFINLSRGRLKEVDMPTGPHSKKLELHEALLDEHLLMNLPVMKTSEVTGVSLSVKNLFGLLPHRMKAKFHSSINETIFDLGSFFRRSLTILDARVGMEGNGPVYGEVVKGGYALLGSDHFSVDAVAVSAMGFDPSTIPYLRWAEEKGMSKWSQAQVIGTPLAQVRRDFRAPKGVPTLRRISYGLQEKAYTRPIMEIAARLLAKKRAIR